MGEEASNTEEMSENEMKKVNKHLTKCVRLNVGGVIFNTTISTLCSCPESTLAKMFAYDGESFKLQPKDRSGAFLIDSSPILFGCILDWCRYKKLVYDHSKIDLDSLIAAADYFGLEDMIESIQSKKRMYACIRNKRKLNEEKMEKNLRTMNKSLKVIATIQLKRHNDNEDLLNILEEIKAELSYLRVS